MCAAPGGVDGQTRRTPCLRSEIFAQVIGLHSTVFGRQMPSSPSQSSMLQLDPGPAGQDGGALHQAPMSPGQVVTHHVQPPSAYAGVGSTRCQPPTITPTLARRTNERRVSMCTSVA